MPSLKKILNIVSKPWGKYIIFEKNKDHWIKKLFIKRGSRLSLQSHRYRSEIWIVLSGEIQATKGERTISLLSSDTIKIDRGEPHRIFSKTDSWILEIAFGHVLERDIKRYQDDYGRAK